MLIALGLVNIAMVAAFLLTYNNLPPQIPLFYSRIWGEQQLADTWFIFLLPLFLDIFFFLNLYLYNKIFFPNQLMRYIFHTLNWFLIVVTTLFFMKQLFFIS